MAVLHKHDLSTYLYSYLYLFIFILLRQSTLSYRKWFLQALGLDGLNNLLMAYEDKSAQAVCTFAYCEGPGHEVLIFEGRVHVSCERAWVFVLPLVVVWLIVCCRGR